uniref:Uncharacterized protein n=1 Tax=Arundo donax TaxID=35708 RepID=A0A0A9AG93_ARUDO
MRTSQQSLVQGEDKRTQSTVHMRNQKMLTN